MNGVALLLLQTYSMIPKKSVVKFAPKAPFCESTALRRIVRTEEDSQKQYRMASSGNRERGRRFATKILIRGHRIFIDRGQQSHCF